MALYEKRAACQAMGKELPHAAPPAVPTPFYRCDGNSHLDASAFAAPIRIP